MICAIPQVILGNMVFKISPLEISSAFWKFYSILQHNGEILHILKQRLAPSPATYSNWTKNVLCLPACHSCIAICKLLLISDYIWPRENSWFFAWAPAFYFTCTIFKSTFSRKNPMRTGWWKSQFAVRVIFASWQTAGLLKTFKEFYKYLMSHNFRFS